MLGSILCFYWAVLLYLCLVEFMGFVVLCVKCVIPAGFGFSENYFSGVGVLLSCAWGKFMCASTLLTSPYLPGADGSCA